MCLLSSPSFSSLSPSSTVHGLDIDSQHPSREQSTDFLPFLFFFFLDSSRTQPCVPRHLRYRETPGLVPTRPSTIPLAVAGRLRDA